MTAFPDRLESAGVHPNVLLPLASSAVCFVFAALVLAQRLKRRRSFQLAWYLSGALFVAAWARSTGWRERGSVTSPRRRSSSPGWSRSHAGRSSSARRTALARGQLHSRVPATLLIALGGFIPGITSGLKRFGVTWSFFLRELLGVLLIFLGFIVCTEVFSARVRSIGPVNIGRREVTTN